MVVDKAIFSQGTLALLVMMSVLMTVVAKVTVVIWILLSLYKAAH